MLGAPYSSRSPHRTAICDPPPDPAVRMIEAGVLGPRSGPPREDTIPWVVPTNPLRKERPCRLIYLIRDRFKIAL